MLYSPHMWYKMRVDRSFSRWMVQNLYQLIIPQLIYKAKIFDNPSIPPPSIITFFFVKNDYSLITIDTLARIFFWLPAQFRLGR